MTRSLLLALPCLGLAAPALALEPQELWTAWQAQAAGFGLTLTAEAVPGPDGSLTLRNFEGGTTGGRMQPMAADSPIQEVVLRPTGDGAVAIDLGLPLRLDIPNGVEYGTDLRLEHQGLAITARDVPEGIDYEVAADSIRFASLPPSTPDPMEGDFAAEIAGLRATFPGQIGEDRMAEATLSIDGFAYVSNSPDFFSGGTNSDANRTDTPISLAAAVTLPEGFDIEAMEGAADFVRALDGGLALRLTSESGAGSQTARYEGFPFSYSYDSVTEPGRASLSFDRQGLVVEAGYDGGTMTLRLPDLPVPEIDATQGPFAMELRVPFAAEGGDYRFAMSLADFALGEGAWAALDPGGLLPHDPLGLSLDLGGRLSLDLGAFAAAEDAGTTYTPSVDTLELRSFELRGAGLLASATAQLAFDYSGWMPVPVGTASARIDGLDRLLDALVALGAIGSEQATQARMGLAFVFRAGAEPDSREAAFEFRADGSVFANGVQLQ